MLAPTAAVIARLPLLARPAVLRRADSVRRASRRRLAVAAVMGEGSDASRSEPPSPPAFTSKLDVQNYQRVQALEERQLRTRIKRTKNTDKLASLIRVLESCGKRELAAQARDALAALAPDRADASSPPTQPSPSAGATAGAAPGKGAGRGKAAGKQAQLTARQQVQVERTASRLRDKGMEVFLPVRDAEGLHVDWGVLAGYEEQKRQIEDTVLLALANPEVYDRIAARTKARGAQAAGSNRPRAVLFEGPPGTGKTTSARVIAQQTCVPLVNVKFEKVLSKWYGEDERNLAEVLQLCEGFPAGAIVFLDELDSLMTSRSDGQGLHEVTRRMLGILLRHLDGFDASRRSVLIGATNRARDLDPALRSRFAATVTFGLPSQESRAAILGQYARQLSGSDLQALASATRGMAGRDLRAVCEQTERLWASEIIRGRVPEDQLPSVMGYLASAEQRLREMRGGEDD